MANTKINKDWHIFEGQGKSKKKENIKFPPAPPWRQAKSEIANKYIIDKDSEELDIVNAGIYLKRPILITGNPGIGKSSLAYAIAEELGLELVKWEITTKTTLKDGLYSYDAIARLQDISLQSKDNCKKKTKINDYLFLGALGYAFDNPIEGSKPKVLLIDEIDKSDIDLPNDLLHIFEDMEFLIPELERADKKGKGIEIFPMHKKESQKGIARKIENGKVFCLPDNFPIILMTSNDEREFPPAFLRRCIRLDMIAPSEKRLRDIVKSYYKEYFKNISASEEKTMEEIVNKFWTKNDGKYTLSTDQLLNAMQLLFKDKINILEDKKLMDNIFRSLVD